MKDKLILGFFLEPPVWVVSDNEIVDAESISPKEILAIVFEAHFANGVQVCIQRQGCVVVSFPEKLLNIKLSSFKVGNLLPIDATQPVLSFFNALLFLIYDQTYKHYNGRFQSINQAVVVSDLWRWSDDSSSSLKEIAIRQPSPMLNQQEFLKIEMAPHLMSKTIGDLTNTDKSFRAKLPSQVLNDALEVMFKVNEPQKNWQLLALLNKAVFAIQKADFAESLILSWSVAESLINYEWEKYIQQTNQEIGSLGEKTLNSKRLKLLTSSAKYDAFLKIEIFELAKIIPYELYKKLEIARKARNNWLHSLEPVSQEVCRESYLVARDLLSRKINIEIQHPGAFYMQADHFS